MHKRYTTSGNLRKHSTPQTTGCNQNIPIYLHQSGHLKGIEFNFKKTTKTNSVKGAGVKQDHTKNTSSILSQTHMSKPSDRKSLSYEESDPLCI